MVKKVLLLLFICLDLAVLAKDPPPAPTEYRWVQDEINLLSAEQEGYLLSKLKAYYDSTSTEIAIVIEASLEGDDVQRYSEELAEKWAIGTKGKDNGILIYIAYENDNPRKRKIWIQVGYGMEGVVPDIIASRIVREVMAPKFKQKRYGEGLNDAVDVIIKLAAGEFVFDDKPKAKGIPVWVIIVIIIVAIALFSNNSNGGTSYRGRGNRGTIWTTGGWGSSGGGFSGGGFGGGFGGGGFGGGGAGGSW